MAGIAGRAVPVAGARRAVAAERDLDQGRFVSGEIRVAIHQPGYHRHLYYFAKMAEADVFVSLDTVQYAAREWQNRQAFVYGGRRRWLSVPVGSAREPLLAKRISDPHAVDRHWTLIRQIYRRAPYFDDYADEVSAVYAAGHDRLVDLCDALTDVVRRALGITTEYLPASRLTPSPAATRAALLAELAVLVGRRLDPARAVSYLACATPMRAGHYLCRARAEGPDAGAGTGLDQLAARGVAVRTFGYRHPVYPQAQVPAGAPFEPELAACDLLFNRGPEARAVFGASLGPTMPVGAR